MSKKSEEFKKYAREVIDWIADYYDEIENYPVKSQVKPGDISGQLPAEAPEEQESFNHIMQDLDNVIMPGITHWQSPEFFAYFPANSSIPSLFAEMITAAIGAQCMKWETSPAATELEDKVMTWLQEATALPAHFHGVIQDSASTATLVSILTAREKFKDYQINKNGFTGDERLRVYCSEEAHSSVERAVKVAGIGSDNIVKIPVDKQYRMDVPGLYKAIEQDIDKGLYPLCIIATIGTTGPTSIDPLKEISEVKKEFGLWLHVDAAYAGNALLLEEYRWMIKGIEEVDSFVMNPHKWLFTNFDCSAYYVKNKEALIKTFQIVPEYLKSKTDKVVNNYSDWTIPLGRRFRALKLWFVLRYYGLKQIREKLRYHINLANELKTWIEEDGRFEILAPVTFNLVCFRFHPETINEIEQLNALNETLMHKINDSGNIYLTHTKLNGNYTLRMVIGQTDVERRHVVEAWKTIREIAEELG
ncbi:MAG: pyridoxal phosphate-dependent decarboxylase family protein [Bacteroidales bacterium]